MSFQKNAGCRPRPRVSVSMIGTPSLSKLQVNVLFMIRLPAEKQQKSM